MNLLNIEHIRKVFGEKVIFDDASVGIGEGDKIGIIGINGTGKTTLLRMIAGEEEPEVGQIVCQNGIKTAWLPQNPSFPKGATVLSYAGEGTQEWRVVSNLNKLGITQHNELLENLSGGQRRKVALAKVLAADFDLLLLDEPTNHLDNEMLSWLENYLKSYKGTVIMVTHDRYFLDKVSNRILEISHGKIYSYASDYSSFLELKAQREEMALASERKRQSILRMELEWAKRGCQARSTKQRARLLRLEQLKDTAAPMADENVEIASVQTRMGKKTIELHHVSKAFGDKKIVEDFSYTVLKNQRLGFIGPNGCGKSTLLKIIAGLIEPDSGFVDVGETVKIGYLAQEEPDMDTNQRVIDYIKDIAEYVQTSEGRISASQMLERFLFTPDMQYTPIAKLSGGERRRLYLLSILVRGVNVFILDEPSNNVDIPTLTILEDYLNSFSGIVITVSHDRYFLDNIVDRIFEFDGSGSLCQYEGGYTDYLAAKERKAQAAEKPGKDTAKLAQEADGASLKARENNKSWKGERPKKLKFTFKEQREYETIDDDIASMEEKLARLDEEIMENATNSARLSQLMGQKEEALAALDMLMDRWVYLTELAEKIEAQKKEGL
ncbi:MAG: ABC-F family ATP-binding cassette domain-containing protein [Clostridiales bacterium]|nr:ABC-F family ATP-binding cassette domain-containing protein [Clostridiales bacterium]